MTGRGSAGIIAYGTYLPAPRIAKEEFVLAWGRFVARGISEKAVTDCDEDSMTMAVEAARACIGAVGGDAASVGFLATASSAYPYDEKFHPAMIAEALGLDRHVQAMQFGGSSKAGTEAAIAGCYWAIASSAGAVGLVAAGDAPRADASADLDHALGAGAAAFLVGSEPHPIIARLEGVHSTLTETMGNWYRPAGSPNVQDMGVPAYSEDLFYEVVGDAVRGLLKRLGRSPDSYTHVVFQQPDGEMPRRLGRALGFGEKQLAVGLVVVKTGNTGAASALLGLAAVLDDASPGDRVLVASFGSGSGADAMSFEVTDAIRRVRRPTPMRVLLSSSRKLTYMQYLRLRGRL